MDPKSLVYIHPDARIADDVIIEPFTTIAADVEIGSGTWIGPNVTIMDGARIGKDCRIFPGAVISSVPQDLKYRGEKTTCVIGDRTTIHEGVTVSRGTQAAGTTRVGDDCLLRAYVHVAHDCILGNHVILANYVGLTGHCQVDDYAIIGGLAGTHQFTKIGAHAMIAGGTLIRTDVPPSTKAAKEPISYIGVNSIGLHRRGFTSEKVDEIRNVYRVLYQSGHNISQALEIIEQTLPPSKERDEIVRFVRQSQRGIMRGYAGCTDPDAEEE